MIAGRGRRRAGRRRLRDVGLERFFQAYLVAYTFWMGIALGSLALLMVQHLSGGAWGIVIRRPLEAAVRTHAGDGGAVPADRVRHARHLHWTHADALQRSDDRSRRRPT